MPGTNEYPAREPSPKPTPPPNKAPTSQPGRIRSVEVRNLGPCSVPGPRGGSLMELGKSSAIAVRGSDKAVAVSKAGSLRVMLLLLLGFSTSRRAGLFCKLGAVACERGCISSVHTGTSVQALDNLSKPAPG